MGLVRRALRQLGRGARWIASLSGTAVLQAVTSALVILVGIAWIVTLLDMREARAQLWEQMYYTRDLRAEYEEKIAEEDKIAICAYRPDQRRAETSEELYEMYWRGELDCE